MVQAGRGGKDPLRLREEISGGLIATDRVDFPERRSESIERRRA